MFAGVREEGLSLFHSTVTKLRVEMKQRIKA